MKKYNFAGIMPFVYCCTVRAKRENLSFVLHDSRVLFLFYHLEKESTGIHKIASIIMNSSLVKN